MKKVSSRKAEGCRWPPSGPRALWTVPTATPEGRPAKRSCCSTDCFPGVRTLPPGGNVVSVTGIPPLMRFAPALPISCAGPCSQGRANNKLRSSFYLPRPSTCLPSAEGNVVNLYCSQLEFRRSFDYDAFASPLRMTANKPMSS